MIVAANKGHIGGALSCTDILVTLYYGGILRFDAGNPGWDELLNGEVFTRLIEARILIEQWRREYNQVRPHSSLGYRPPAPEARIPVTLT